MTNFSLTVLTVTHNSRHILDSFLPAVDRWKSSLLVVDNGSEDGTVAYLEQKGVRVHAVNENLGFGRAANLGVAQSSTPYFCLINPDCRPSPVLFQKGFEKLINNPQSCIVPGSIVQGGQIFTGVQPGYTRLKLIKDMLETNGGPASLVRRLDNHAKLHDRSWRWPLGTCLFMARDFFERINGFDPSFFMYCEDVDLGRRIAAAGGSILSLDEPLVHDGGNSSRIEAGKKIRLLNRGRLRYARIHYGPVFALGLAAVMRGSLFYRKIKSTKGSP